MSRQQYAGYYRDAVAYPPQPMPAPDPSYYAAVDDPRARPPVQYAQVGRRPPAAVQLQYTTDYAAYGPAPVPQRQTMMQPSQPVQLVSAAPIAYPGSVMYQDDLAPPPPAMTRQVQSSSSSSGFDPETAALIDRAIQRSRPCDPYGIPYGPGYRSVIIEGDPRTADDPVFNSRSTDVTAIKDGALWRAVRAQRYEPPPPTKVNQQSTVTQTVVTPQMPPQTRQVVRSAYGLVSVPAPAPIAAGNPLPQPVPAYATAQPQQQYYYSYY